MTFPNSQFEGVLSMATWGEYQSIIQLGAALNFGYAAFDVVFQSASSPITLAYDKMLQKVNIAIERRAQSVGRVGLSPNQFQSAKMRHSIIKKASRFISRMNPEIPFISGITCVVLLVYSSEIYTSPISLWQRITIIVCSYGCIAAMCIATGIAFLLSRNMK